MIDDTKEAEKHGKPWKVVGKFADFKGADLLRKGILLENDENLTVKVKKLSNGFVVKTRNHGNDETEQESTEERDDQPKRGKKRRKGKNRRQ